VDVTRGPDGVQVVLLRLLHRRITLREDANQLAPRDGFINQADGALARDRQRHERVGKQHRVAQRKDRQLVGQLQRPFAGRELFEVQSVVAFGHGADVLLLW
jgi:hypothetical protein